MNTRDQRQPLVRGRTWPSDSTQPIDAIRFVITLSVLLLCRTSVATTEAELAELICHDAVQSGQMADQAEINDFMKQCMAQLMPQLEKDSVVEESSDEPPDELKHRKQ